VSAPTSRLDAIKARLAAATQEPWFCEPSADFTEVYGLLVGSGSVGFEDMASADINLIIDAPDDLRWAVQEIEFLRLYLAVLGDFAYALDAYRWALENPKPGRLERRRRALDEARQELEATPSWRPGECHGGCRRYATHELVIEREGGSAREPRCEECGRRDVECCTALLADHVPPVTARLERLPEAAREARG
jgi:hypothetical protein